MCKSWNQVAMDLLCPKYLVKIRIGNGSLKTNGHEIVSYKHDSVWIDTCLLIFKSIFDGNEAVSHQPTTRWKLVDDLFIKIPVIGADF